MLIAQCSTLFVQDHPISLELINAVAQFLNTELAPTLNDPRLKFRALVAANVLQIVAREMELGNAFLRAEHERLLALLPSPDFKRGGDVSSRSRESISNMRDDTSGGEVDLHADIAAMNRELCQLIRAGKADKGAFHDAMFAHVEQTVTEKLQIANPKYLERVRHEQ